VQPKDLGRIDIVYIYMVDVGVRAVWMNVPGYIAARSGTRRLRSPLAWLFFFDRAEGTMQLFLVFPSSPLILYSPPLFSPSCSFSFSCSIVWKLFFLTFSFLDAQTIGCFDFSSFLSFLKAGQDKWLASTFIATFQCVGASSSKKDEKSNVRRRCNFFARIISIRLFLLAIYFLDQTRPK
jgi:hypothetical protein